MFKEIICILALLSIPTVSFAGEYNRDLQIKLSQAAKAGDWKALSDAIDQGANGSNRSFLHWAAGEGHVSDLKKFVQDGSNLEAKDDSGWTPLILSAFSGKTDSVEALINLGAQIEATSHTKNTALQMAAVAGYQDVVKLLIAKGANLENKNYVGDTTLHVAATTFKNPSLVNILLDKNADASAKNNKGETPLDIAIKRKEEAVKMASEEQNPPKWIMDRVNGYTEIVKILKSH